MFGDRHEIVLTLEAVTPLHIGSGDVSPVWDEAGDNAEYATVTRDHMLNPYLPATSIKGALRRLAELWFPNDPGFVPLLGDTRRSEKGVSYGNMGRLLVRGGHVTGAVPDAAKAPFANITKTGAFIAARTAIDKRMGVADDHKLYHQEMILPTMCFRIPMTLVSFGRPNDQEHALSLLRRLLALVAYDGLTLGRSQTDGQGQLKIKGTITVQRHRLNDHGDLMPAETIIIGTTPTSSRIQDVDRKSFVMVCHVPFAVVDSSVKGAGKDVAKQQGTIQISAQRLTSDQPLVLGSSISGSLRARADWLWKIDQLRGTEYKDDPVEELFGHPEWRALIEIRNLNIGKAKAELVTSLKVDRFTGAPVHGALFTTDAFTETRLSFDLVLTRRGKGPSQAAAEIWRMLLDDIKHNGLSLGHGTNKGFGWFTQESAA